MSTTTPVTADQLLRMPDDGYRYELVAGELRKMVSASWEHGAVGSNLHSFLGPYIREKKLGQAFIAEGGFLIARDPDTVRVPDIAFIHKDHLPATRPEEAFWPKAPDLCCRGSLSRRYDGRGRRKGSHVARCRDGYGLGGQSAMEKRDRLP